MSAVARADNNEAPDGSPSARAISDQVTRTGEYLTDEVFLYRVVGPVGNGVVEMVELEDCYRLDIVRIPSKELDARRLRVVTPVREES